MLRVEAARYRLRRRSVAILLIGAAAAATVTLWPFFPALLALAPIAVVLTLTAWLLVVSRLANAGPREFLELAAGDPEAGSP